MAKKKGNSFNRKKSSGSKGRQLATLIFILVLIALAFFLLEESKRYVGDRPVVEGARQKMPSRPHLKDSPPEGYSNLAPSHTPDVAKPRARVSGPGTVAIIIDDMGRSTKQARALLAIDLPITFAVIPGFSQAKAVAQIAHDKGGEIMIHLPMQPHGYPQKKIELNGLLISDTADQLVGKVKGYLQEVPYAVGANNHMGSQFTEDEDRMRTVLQVLKDRDLFFIDSRTSPQSVALQVARQIGLKAEGRQVFLDNVQDVAAIRAQLQQVVNVARKRGNAIAICHPYQTTIRALSDMMPQLQKEGITFVFASQLAS